MKSTSYIAITLFFLMLLLVLGAAFIFLFQAQVTLEERLDSMATAQETLIPAATIEAEVGNATRVALQSQLAEEQNNSVLLENDLVASQQQVQQLGNALTETELALIEANRLLMKLQEQAPSVLQPEPTVQILINDEAGLRPFRDTAVWVVAADVSQILTVSLTIDEAEPIFFNLGNEQLFAQSIVWRPPANGDYRLVATAESISGSLARVEKQVMVGSNGGEEETAVYETTLFDQIEANIASIRGVLPIIPIERIFVTPEELAQRLAERSQPSAATAQVLAAFGLLPSQPVPSAEPIAFYDPQQRVILVSEPAETLSAIGQAQYAREYFLALQDQQENLTMLQMAATDDAKTALWALAEGEANLVANQFAAQYLNEETAVFVGHNPALMQGVAGAFLRLNDAPGTVATRFAQALFDRAGGYEGLEDAWFDLPTSTEQVLAPEQYPDDVPERVTLPELAGTLGSGWSLVGENSLGVWGIETWLTQLATPDEETAVVGWSGDLYAVYAQESSEQLLLAFRIVWDTPADSEQFDLLFSDYAANLYGEAGDSLNDQTFCWQAEDVLCIITASRDTLIVRAPNYNFITAVFEQISP